MLSTPLSPQAGQARRGPVSILHAILASLAGGPLHGYAVRSRLQERLGFLWPVNHGQVYATLGRLASDGRVTTIERGDAGRSGPERRYERSASGGRALVDWLRRPVPISASGGEIGEKIATAIACGEAAVVDSFLARQIESCATLLDTCRQASRGRDSTTDPARGLLERAALRMLETDLAWLEAVRAACAGSAPAEPGASPDGSAEIRACPAENADEANPPSPGSIRPASPAASSVRTRGSSPPRGRSRTKALPPSSQAAAPGPSRPKP